MGILKNEVIATVQGETVVYFLIIPTPSKVIGKIKDTDTDTVLRGEQSGVSWCVVSAWRPEAAPWCT